MGKKHIKDSSPRYSPITSEQIDNALLSLVERGLCSRGILDSRRNPDRKETP